MLRLSSLLHTVDKPLGQIAYEAVRELVMAQKVPPGSLLREGQLAHDLGVSRTPVREALRRLQAENLLSYLPHVGYRVSDLDSSMLEDLYLIRSLLEGLAARLAAQRSTRVDVAELEELLERMKEANSSGKDALLVELNDAFHAAVAHASGSSALESMLRSIADVFKRYRHAAIADPPRRRASSVEHHTVAAAIAARDERAAERAATEHVQHAFEVRLAALRKMPRSTPQHPGSPASPDGA